MLAFIDVCVYKDIRRYAYIYACIQTDVRLMDTYVYQYIKLFKILLQRSDCLT